MREEGGIGAVIDGVMDGRWREMSGGEKEGVFRQGNSERFPWIWPLSHINQNLMVIPTYFLTVITELIS